MCSFSIQECAHLRTDGAAVNGSSTSPSSPSSSTNEKAEGVEGNVGDVPSSPTARKRRASFSTESAITVETEIDTAEDGGPSSKGDSTLAGDQCSAPKRRIIAVDQLLPKLFAVIDTSEPLVNGVLDDGSGGANDGCMESAEATPSESNNGASRKLNESGSDGSPIQEEVANRSTIRRAESFNEDEVGRSTTEDQSASDERNDGDFATPPAVASAMTKERLVMSFMHAPPPLLYPLMSYGLTVGGHQASAVSALAHGSPPIRKLSKPEYFRTENGVSTVMLMLQRPAGSRKAIRDLSGPRANGRTTSLVE